jgi:integrase
LVRQRDSTVNAYAKDVRQYLETYGGTIPCTADELIAYIRLLARRVAPATIVRRVMAIQSTHAQRGLALPTDDPRIREALRLMASNLPPLNLGVDVKGSSVLAPKRDSRKRSAAPITRTLLTRMIDAMGSGARSLDRRDRALLLLGFVGGLKRGTICALNIQDFTFTPDAMLVRIKAAADGEAGRTIVIPVTRGPLCAATAVHQWIAHNAMEGCNGPLFPRFTRSGEPVLTERLDSAYVSKLVKARLRDAGVEDVAAYSGESLRLGHTREFDGCRRS